MLYDTKLMKVVACSPLIDECSFQGLSDYLNRTTLCIKMEFGLKSKEMLSK